MSTTTKAGATPAKDPADMTAVELQALYYKTRDDLARLLDVALLFLRGIEGGHIKCAPYIDFDPNAAQLEIKSPATRLRAAIAAAQGTAP